MPDPITPPTQSDNSDEIVIIPAAGAETAGTSAPESEPTPAPIIQTPPTEPTPTIKAPTPTNPVDAISAAPPPPPVEPPAPTPLAASTYNNTEAAANPLAAPEETIATPPVIITPPDNQPASASSMPRAAPPNVLDSIWRFLKGLFAWLVFPALLVLILHVYVVQPFYVHGQSMEPSFHDNDYLIISKVEPSLNSLRQIFTGKPVPDTYARGQVLVFHYPKNPSLVFIKRIAGLPGEHVVVASGQVIINGKVLKENFIKPDTPTIGNIDEIVPPNDYFMLGDNRTPDGSSDSREWGDLPQANIIGRVVVRLYPLNAAGLINLPNYN